MRVPLEWLKDFVAIRLTPERLAERLTMAGLEVTSIEPGPDGPVLDLDITPNRADCLSIIGIAREVAAITGERFTLPPARGKRSAAALHPTRPRADLSISIEDRRGCARYIGRLIEGATIKPSPDWMQRRLIACGARPINNLVDITNYVLLEHGQPLHAFDADRLSQLTIRVRRAQAKESLTTLDGVKRTLTADTLVIADAAQPVAVAGIMGGTGSEVTPKTQTALLESALFDPVAVRRTARKLGLASESSYRFERGVDPEGVERASARAAQLMSELAGGRETTVRDVGATAARQTVIALEPLRAQRWLGTAMASSAMRTTLVQLGCRVASSGSSGPLHVTPPSYRRDLTSDVDLCEELARLAGYDRLPSSMPTAALAGGSSDNATGFARVQSLRHLCASVGLTEVVTWSLVSDAELSRCGYAPDGAVRLANPLSQDHAVVRPSLLMGMLQAVRRNVAQGAQGVRIFEVGKVAPPSAAGAPAEQWRLGVGLSGLWCRDWRGSDVCDLFRLKGVLQALCARLRVGMVELADAKHPWAQPEESTAVTLNGQAVGCAGLVARAITTALDVEQDVWFAELSVEPLLAATEATPQAPTMFPSVKRDLSVVVDSPITYNAIHRAIVEAAGALATRVDLIDRYTGQQVPGGKYSVTFSMEYRDPARTLTAEEADAVHQRVIQTLTRQFSAQLR